VGGAFDVFFGARSCRVSSFCISFILSGAAWGRPVTRKGAEGTPNWPISFRGPLSTFFGIPRSCSAQPATILFAGGIRRN
jgi:hypothetical protein